MQQGLLLSDQIGAGRTLSRFHCALQELEQRGHGAIIILGDRSGFALSKALDDEDERRAIPLSGWALAGRTLGELGFGSVELIDAPTEGASMLHQFGLSAQ